MNYNCTPRSLWSGRCIVLLSVLTLFLLIYILSGLVRGISEPVVDTYAVCNQTFIRLNNSSQQGVTNMNSQKMNSLNKSSKQGVTDVSSQKNKSRSITLRPQGPADLHSQKMNRLKTLLQEGVAEDDPKLIQLIRADFVVLPGTKPYNLKDPTVHDYSCGQSSAMYNVLSQKLEFNRGNEMGRVWVDQEDKNWVREMKMKVNVIEVSCFSLYSVLLAVNQTTIDYFSLDVEGRELSVLQSIPFDKLHIDTLTVEYLNGNDDNYYKDIKSFMAVPIIFNFCLRVLCSIIILKKPTENCIF